LEKPSPTAVKKMADLLRAGAAMLAERCPACGLPLFKLKSGETVCPVHGRVYVVKTDEEASRVTLQGVLEELERNIVSKLAGMRDRIGDGDSELARELIVWLEALERIERLLGRSPSTPPK